MADSYILVKDRHPRISQVLNDCVNLCVPTYKDEPLSSILQKICSKIDTIESPVINNQYISSSYLEAGSNITITGSGTESDPWILSSSANSADYWKVAGNAGTSPSTNFLGTTDLQPLVFKINNEHAGYISAFTGLPAATNGAVVLGQYAGYALGTSTVHGNTLIGHAAGYSLQQNPSKSHQNTFVGLWAGYSTQGFSDPFGGRSVLVGQSTAFRNYDGSSLTYVGTFAGELNHRGNVNTGIGRDALRSNIDGNYNTALGGLSLLYNTTGIKTISVTNGGSGYTTAIVTISAPLAFGPGVYQQTATATATVSGGQVTAITVTNPGGGYSISPGGSFQTGITVTITGDGVGATAVVTETKSGTGNIAIGMGSALSNKYGNYNINIGYLSASRTEDDYCTFIGYTSGIGTSASTKITGSTSIGYNAKVSADYSIALGGTGAYAVKVGVNTETPRKRLDIVGDDILVNEITIGRGSGAIVTNTVVGNEAMLSNVASVGNTVIGYQAFRNVVTSNANTVIGYRANNNSSYAGGANTIIGYEACYNNNPSEAVAIGIRAMYTQGSSGSVAVGNYALYSNVRDGFSGYQWNTAIGDHSFSNYGGLSILQINTGLGAYSGYGMTAGSYNVAVGSLSMGRGWVGVGTVGGTGSYNVGLGHASLYYQNNSNGNIGIGFNAFFNSSFAPTLGYNIAIGYYAGTAMTTGNYNVILGGTPAASYATLSNHMVFADGQGNERFHINNTGDMILHTIQEHADNAAAVTAGLVVGTIYRTGDNLKIVH